MCANHIFAFIFHKINHVLLCFVMFLNVITDSRERNKNAEEGEMYR